jgi:trehalose 6-phosphate synthase/phosphatase
MTFDQSLELYLNWNKKVVLIQVTSPISIKDLTDFKNKIVNKVNEFVTKINSSYKSPSYSPV